MNYTEADAKLQGRNKNRRKLANHTYLERRGPDAIAVKLHATDVLTFYKDGRIDLDNGRYPTVTTHDRMNNYLPAGYRVCGEPVENGRSNGGMTVLLRGNWQERRQEVTLADNTAIIHADGTLSGGDVVEYRKERREERNAAARPRNRARAWLRKSIGIYMDRSKCTASSRWGCELASRWNRRQNTVLDDGQNERTLACGCRVYYKVSSAKNLTPQSILAEQNETVKAAQIQIYGFENFFRDANPKVLDAHENYQLLEIETGAQRWGRPDSIRALKMVCNSTGNVHIHAVPEDEVQTVAGALDWMYQVKDYLGTIGPQA